MENQFIDKEIKKGTDFIFGIGYFSEIIMAIIVIIALHTNRLNTIVYIIFFFLSGYTNTLLKSFFRQSRPKKSIKFLYSEHFSRIHTVYGMPSGHSQDQKSTRLKSSHITNWYAVLCLKKKHTTHNQSFCH